MASNHLEGELMSDHKPGKPQIDRESATDKEFLDRGGLASNASVVEPTNINHRPEKPAPVRVDAVIETLHGRQIADPYHWLENAESVETQRFVREQNAYTRSVLEAVPGREHLRRRIEQLLTIGRVASPRIGGNKYFYERRDGRQDQPVVYVRDRASSSEQRADGASRDPREIERVLIDVNALSPD